MFVRSQQMRHCMIALSVITSMCATILPLSASAVGNTRLLLRPHCNDAELENRFGGPLPDLEQLTKLTEGTCHSYEVRDPESVQTKLLNVGDILDFDLVLENPAKRPIKRFRAWLAYDTTIFEGVDLAIAKDFSIPTPGENEFVAADGYIKLSGTSNKPIDEEKIPLAHVRLRVLRTVPDGSPIIFYDATGTTGSKTGVFEEETAEEVNILTPSLGYLFVRFDAPVDNKSQSSATSSVDATMTVAGATSSTTATQTSTETDADHTAATTSTVFTMLQVQGVRVTTEGSSVFLAWDALPSSELNGYYIYYGTTSGRYIQRRAVEKEATSITIRALPVGTTYYFAVRAVNSAGQETEFSNEVGISVGNARTSTSPLTGNTRPTQTPGTNGSVAGETGTSSVLLFLLIGSAVAGTFVAFRRQWRVQSA